MWKWHSVAWVLTQSAFDGMVDQCCGYHSFRVIILICILHVFLHSQIVKINIPKSTKFWTLKSTCQFWNLCISVNLHWIWANWISASELGCLLLKSKNTQYRIYRFFVMKSRHYAKRVEVLFLSPWQIPSSFFLMQWSALKTNLGIVFLGNASEIILLGKGDFKLPLFSALRKHPISTWHYSIWTFIESCIKSK